MNKCSSNSKMIKILLSIIVFMFFILILSNKTFAITIKPTKEQFCLNRGQPFSTKTNYNAEDQVDTGINGKFDTLPKQLLDSNGNPKVAGADSMLAYILSEVPHAEEDRPSMGASEYQVAIWALTGVTTVTDPTFPMTSNDYLERAAQLYADAIAYNNFLSNNSGVTTTTGTSVTISKGDGFMVQTIQGKTGKYLGPFKIKYKTATGTVNRRIFGSAKTGHYGNIMSIKLSDGTTTKTISKNLIVCDASSNGDADTTFDGYPASGVLFYLPLNGLSESENEYKITVKFNNKARYAYYQYLKNSTSVTTYYSASVNGKTLKFYQLSDGKLFCDESMTRMEPNFEDIGGQSIIYECPYCRNVSQYHNVGGDFWQTDCANCSRDVIALAHHCGSCHYGINGTKDVLYVFKNGVPNEYDLIRHSGRTPCQQFLTGGGNSYSTIKSETFITIPKL